LRSAGTNRAAERLQIDLLRNATVACRAALARSLSSMAIRLSHRAFRAAHPTIGADELAVRWVALCYGRELADGLRRDLKTRRLRKPWS